MASRYQVGMESRVSGMDRRKQQRRNLRYTPKGTIKDVVEYNLIDFENINEISRRRLAKEKMRFISGIMGLQVGWDWYSTQVGEVEFLKMRWDDVVEDLINRLHLKAKGKYMLKIEAVGLMYGFCRNAVLSLSFLPNNINVEPVRRINRFEDVAKLKETEIGIKRSEDVAKLKESEVEEKLIVEIQEQISEMHMVSEKLKEVEKEQQRMEKIKEVDIEKEQLRKDRYMEKLKELDIEQTSLQKRKRKKRLVYKMKLVERKMEKEIMNKIEKMIQLDFRKMTFVEVMEKLKGAYHIMKKIEEAKKEAEIIEKIKLMIETEIMRKETEFIKESEEEENTSSMASDSTPRTKHSKIGTVREAAAKLFDASMERCHFSNIKQPALIFSCTKEEYGDYTCDNVLRIWPELKKIGTKLQGPKDVGEEILRNLPQSDMIEETPSLHSVGFLSFKISGKWMAKRIHRMLIEGIETWAPEVFLERAIVAFPSPDIAEGMHMDMLRRRYVSRSLARMLEYCQVHVLNNAHEARHMDFARNRIKIEECDGKVLIYNKAQGGLIVEGKSDGGLGNVSKDIGALCYGVEKLNAQWLLYVTPVAKKEYIEMCFSAAKGAGWLSNAPFEPPCATYVGYRSCTTKLEKLVYMLNNAEALHKVASFVLRGDVANYTARDVLECAIQYTFLKTHRMADYTFDIDEILDEQGDTFLYILNTQARIRSTTNKHRQKIILDLKTASEWILEKEDLLMKGEERELGFHILDFTEVLRVSCFPVLPHILCKYLYNLSEIFNRYFVSTFARGWSLFLCEATAVVMDKCFHLLEITLQSFKNELGVTQLIYGAQLSVERPIDVCRNPPRIPNTRFEPFSIHLRVNQGFESYCETRVIKLFGYIDVADTCGLRSDGWTLTKPSDVCYVELFRRLWTDPIDMIDGGCLSFRNPSCCRSVPISSSMGIAMDLAAINEKEDDIYPICCYLYDLDVSRFLDSNLDGSWGHFEVEGEGGQLQINYALLRDAVDATLEVTFDTSLENLEVCGEIVAYYEGGFSFDSDAFEKTFYTASLLQLNYSILKSGPVQLLKSQMAVPRKGSLKIEAHLIEVNSRTEILSTFCDFPSQTESSSRDILVGRDCCFKVKVNWSYVQDDI